MPPPRAAKSFPVVLFRPAHARRRLQAKYVQQQQQLLPPHVPAVTRLLFMAASWNLKKKKFILCFLCACFLTFLTVTLSSCRLLGQKLMLGNQLQAERGFWLPVPFGKLLTAFRGWGIPLCFPGSSHPTARPLEAHTPQPGHHSTPPSRLLPRLH